MKKLFILIVSIPIFSCTDSSDRETKSTPIEKVITEHYELHLSKNERSPLLIVFPDLGGNPQSTKQSFNILEVAKTTNISVLLMNFNHHLFLSKEDNSFLTKTLEGVLKSYKLSPNKVIIGGFSSGGIVSSLWGNHLLQLNHPYKPEKVFVVDSPLDLVELFNNVTDVDATSHEVSVQEAEYITNYFEEALHTKDSLIEKIAQVSPFDYATLNFNNINELKQIDFRVYTEPDSVWWKENRGFEFDETDAYQLIRFVEQSKKSGWNRLQLIETKDKGYRPNGQRHPHSWSIVDVNELVIWIQEK